MIIKPRFIALYLPQFHPTPLNDEWWGKGYTEWRAVTQARPLFKGHYQPHEPADLGFYDLRLPEIREQQAAMAAEYGIEGFCYWHYWMGKGKMLLDRPFKEVLESGKPNFPFCLGWANHNWTNRNWVKQSAFQKDKNLVEMYYSEEDYVLHFQHILPALKDPRYITVDGKPLFYIFAPDDIPDFRTFCSIWQNLAKQNGLEGIHFVAHVYNMDIHFKNHETGKFFIPKIDESGKIYQKYFSNCFDAVCSRGDVRSELLIIGKYRRVLSKILSKFFKYENLKKFDYSKIIENLFVEEDRWENVYPTVIPNWDRSPRAGKAAVIYDKSTPELFKKSILNALEIVKNKNPEHQIIFIKSWNEWGEGNHLEPDLKYGLGYLEAIRNAVREFKAKEHLE